MGEEWGMKETAATSSTEEERTVLPWEALKRSTQGKLDCYVLTKLREKGPPQLAGYTGSSKRRKYEDQGRAFGGEGGDDCGVVDTGQPQNDVQIAGVWKSMTKTSRQQDICTN